MKNMYDKLKEMIILILCTGMISISSINAQFSWEKLNDPDEDSVSLLGISSDNHMYAVNYKVGFLGANKNLYRSTDNGISWTQISYFDETAVNDIYFSSSGVIYLGVGVWQMGGDGSPYGIMQSNDNGENWNLIYEDQPGCGHIEKITMNMTGNLIAIDDGGSIYELSENGEIWETIYNSAKNIVITQKNEYFLCTTYGLMSSNDLGLSWNNRGLRTDVNCIAFYDNQDLIAGSENVGVWYNNGNETWVNIGLTDKKIVALMTHHNEELYVATEDNGFFYTNDNGNTWLSMNEGLESMKISSMKADTTGYLIISTNKGLYRSTKALVNRRGWSTESKVNSSLSYTLYQNYPNPFSESTVINYELTRPTKVRLDIYNSLGQKVTSLLNQQQIAGEHELTWKTKDIDNGLYFCSLKTELGEKVIRLVVTK